MKQVVMEKLPLTLCMEHGPCEGKTFLATHLKKTTIGRTRTNSYPIKDPTVSQKHAFIEWQVDHWAIVDVGSSNGTDVNGKILVENQPMRLQNGDLIRIGDTIKVRVQIEEEEEEEEEDEEEEVEVEVGEEEGMEREGKEAEDQGITVEEWFEQERLRLVRGVQGMADATILEMKQNADELKKRFREHAEDADAPYIGNVGVPLEVVRVPRWVPRLNPRRFDKALNPAGITSRIARKTYGFEVSRAFKPGDPEAAEFISWVGANKKCDVNFSAYVKKGDPLEVDHCVTKDFTPLYPGAKTMKLVLYSSNETDPKHTRGPGVDSKEEGSFSIDISASAHLETKPTVNVSMYFGRSAIEVKAVGKNFGNGEVQGFQLPVEFRGDWV